MHLLSKRFQYFSTLIYGWQRFSCTFMRINGAWRILVSLKYSKYLICAFAAVSVCFCFALANPKIINKWMLRRTIIETIWMSERHKSSWRINNLTVLENHLVRTCEESWVWSVIAFQFALNFKMNIFVVFLGSCSKINFWSSQQGKLSWKWKQTKEKTNQNKHRNRFIEEKQRNEVN